MDFHNRFLYHAIVAFVSLLLVFVLYASGINLIRATAGTAFFLLFLTLIIGPIMRIWRTALDALPWDLPWSWRGELGIWFAIVSITHALFVFSGRQWDAAGYMAEMRLSDLVAIVAVFFSLVLAATSFGKIINYLGVISWRWIHSFTYVVFYLVGAHTINHAFLRPGRPGDWLHWSYLIMMLIVIGLQFCAFLKTVMNYRKSLKDKSYVKE